MAQHSVLSAGQWFKMSVEHDGVYRIDAALMKSMGFNLSQIDPRKISIYGNTGGMLPQQNNSPRPDDLLESAIYVKGEEDGVFNAGDYILFYASGPDGVTFNAAAKAFKYENNLYSDKNFYFITVGDVNGKRIQYHDNTEPSANLITEFNDFVVHEVDQVNVLKSGRKWLGERFDVTLTHNFDLTIPGIVPGSTITLESSVMARSNSGSSFSISLNGSLVGEQNVLPVPAIEHGPVGTMRDDVFTVDENSAGASSRSTQRVSYTFQKTGSGTGYLDYFVLSTVRELTLYGNQTIFRSEKSLSYADHMYSFKRTTSPVTIWDVTDPYYPSQETLVETETHYRFSGTNDSLRTFIAFNGNIPAPKPEGNVPNQNLHGANTPDQLIITHPGLLSEANRLAAHRSTSNNWDVLVVTTDQVYHEFSSGRQDISAIRDFVKYLYTKDPSRLKVLLLFGKCSYDYKDRLERNTNFVPTYESRNSFNPLLSYSSDDYYGFLEDSEGEWAEDPAMEHTLDIGVGRLPVKSMEEAKVAVDKIIAYDTSPDRYGSWRKEFVFVADDGDFNTHHGQSNQLAEYIETTNPEFNTRKIFLDAYPQPIQAAGEISPAASKAIFDAFQKGAVIINYTGHGSERLWAQERIFDDRTLQKLSNKHFPWVVTATCEFGRYDDPHMFSNGENLLLKKDGGAVGMVSTTRLVQSSSNFPLNKAFYEAMFIKVNGRYPAMGELFRTTKNNSQSGVLNRNFSLLGDPGQYLALPAYRVDNIELVTTSGSEVIKALSTVQLTAQIVDEDGNAVMDFDGEAIVTLFDKRTEQQTLGNENSPFSFSEWKNKLFHGRVSVTGGQLSGEFIVPKNIVYSPGEGKLSLYAFENDGREATGVLEDFSIGGSEDDVDPDTSPPVISAFMGDTTFIDGGAVPPNTNLVVKLYDPSGISISRYGIGNGLTAVLDETITFDLSDYYEAELDSYASGWIQFPLWELPVGEHTITVKAWDSHNNVSQSTVHFVVPAEGGLVIEQFANYPNPFSNQTRLFIRHNRSGDNLEGTLTIMNAQGRIIEERTFSSESAPYFLEVAELDIRDEFGINLNRGIYIVVLNVRSITSGVKTRAVTKMIFSN